MDTEEKERGVNGLPLAVTLCNAMISLVDNDYYGRAWCAVEVMMMQAVLTSYGVHQWWEHVLDRDDRSQGTLKKGETRAFTVSSLKLTEETSDRPKIDFLTRQSKLLGRDGV